MRCSVARREQEEAWVHSPCTSSGAGRPQPLHVRAAPRHTATSLLSLLPQLLPILHSSLHLSASPLLQPLAWLAWSKVRAAWPSAQGSEAT